MEGELMFSSVIAKFDQWFIPEWRSCLKFMSVKFNLGTAAVLEAVQVSPVLPDDVRSLIPEPHAHIAVGLWTICGLVARVKSQTPPPPPPANG
jgi:hypothetical protein